jgi:hypothetical protein
MGDTWVDFYAYLYALRSVEDLSSCSSTCSIRISPPYVNHCTGRGSPALASESGDSARARLIRTRRGTWIDKSLLPEARRECLEILREAARKAVGEDTYIPGWISDVCESVDYKADDLSSKRLTPEPTPAQQRREEEIDATVEALRNRGAFEGLSKAEYYDFLFYKFKSIRSKYAAQEAREVASRKRRIPKSNPTLVTEKDLLDLVLDVLHSRSVLDSIIEQDVLRGPIVEECDAEERAREARATARWCGGCGEELSHTCATLLLNSNVHPKYVQELLGHASIAQTLDTYSHVLKGMDGGIGGTMDAALG